MALFFSKSDVGCVMQLRLFDSSFNEIEVCRCCRKRAKVNAKMCEVCTVRCAKGISGKPDKIKADLQRSSIKLNVIGLDGDGLGGIPYSWIVAIENRQSGIRQRAKQRGFTRWATRKQLRELLIKQQFRCMYSGVELSINDVRVGHKTPACRGGSFEVENLAWITNRVNLDMGTMTDVEYMLSKI